MQVDKFVEQFRQALADADPRSTKTARIRLLFPLIEQRLANGSSYAAVVEDLNKAGISVSQTIFSTVLWRIRREKHSASEQVIPSSLKPRPLVAAGAPVRTPPPSSLAVQGRPSSIESPADLRQIHDMDIDLDALREEGRAMRATSKSS
ncbi:hypothetical protein ACXHWJ_03915 [Alcaligenes nematophilus]|uniref:hypothetical protein n=1 Tax=Alcaligenes faecalis TaxID=511 RepID=UPI0019328479|nr:hypothetical protein [Alcaligenes faecalis]QRF90766.1 hypothetical protein CLH39_11210 [Alcaligenes faecalis]